MHISHNISAMNAFRQLSANNSTVSKSLQKLSSGLRINTAADDAAGLSISQKMRGQIRGLGQASRNAQDGISLIQTAEGALSETHSILQRIRELAVQSSSDTYGALDRSAIQQEVDRLTEEITSIAESTTFNTQKLLDGSLSAASGGSLQLRIGEDANQSVALHIGAMDAASFGLTAGTGGGGGSVEKTDGAYVASTVSGTPGFAVDGEAISLTFAQGTPGTAGTPATAARLGRLENTVLNLRSKIAAGSDSQLSISINGSLAATFSAAEFRDWNGLVGVQSGYDFHDLLASKLPSNMSEENDGADWWLLSTTGTGSSQTMQIDVTGSVSAEREAIKSAYGFADDSVTIHGYDAVPGTPGTPSTVTIADNNGHSEVVTVNDSDTSFAGTGYFAGLSVGLTGGSQLSDLTGGGASSITFAASGGASSQGIDVSTREGAVDAITVVDAAISAVSGERASLGAMQNHLEHTVNSLGTTGENLTAAESRIRDVDIAQEMMEYMKDDILAQAATAMLAQANQKPQDVLQLLRSA